MTTQKLMSAALFAMTFTLAIPCRGQSLVGETISVGRRHGRSSGEQASASASVVVGPGVELTNFGFISPDAFPPTGALGFVDIDFSATSVLITLTRNQSSTFLEQLRLMLVNIPPTYVGFTVNPATDWVGFDASRADIDGDNLLINLAGLTGQQGQRILLDLNLSNVPEPSGAALGGLALAGLGALRRRRAVIPAR